MEKRFVFLQKKGLLELLKKLSSYYQVIIPKGDENYFFERLKENFTFNKYRTVHSLRQFFFPSIEEIDTYFEKDSKKYNPFCIVGAKNCDLHSLKVQNCVFLEDEPDLRYKFMYENNLVISSDCTSFKEVCFCLALDIKPYPEEFFDLNISQLEEGYLIEIGSQKGEKIIEENKNLFEEAKENYLNEKEEERRKIIDKLKLHLESQNLPSKNDLYNLIKNNYESEIWHEESLRCVECGACIMNCPTCHCFLIFDTKKEDKFIRARTWDGCQYKNFAKVAGGANPLKFREYRLRNRYIKKFEFFPDRYNLYACTGCGRCIEGCPAKIDIRDIFKKLSQSQTLKKV
jgi:ferredoxin